MFQQDEGLIALIVAGTIMLLLLGIFITSYLFFYQRKHNSHINEQEQLQLHFSQELLKTQYEVQEQTMQTIGTDLHDNIGQLLSLTSLTLNSIELDDLTKARQKIDVAIDLTIHSIKELRQLGKLLQGDQLIVLGLPEAIRYEINWVEKSGKFEINYSNEGDMPAVNHPDKDLIIFRIFQEVLNNIIKHSFATQININLEYLEDRLQLQIGDNGVGFNADGVIVEHRGMGLHNIQKRAGIIGGDAEIKSNPGEGTCVTIFIPYP